jgi:hypothetical protein
VGLPLAILLPELGLPVAAAGLGLLALEFDWAARALASVLRLSERTRGWWRRRSRRTKAVAYTTLAVVVGLAAIGTVELLTA